MAQNRPPRRPTLRDVAIRAGVSFKTVSRVVNGGEGVSEDLTVRVASAVAELGYLRDDRARHLRQTGSQTGTIGFALGDVSNPFYSAILRGIEEVTSPRDYLVLAGSTDDDPRRQQKLIQAFVTRRVDGLIVIPAGEDLGLLGHELGRGTPVIFVDLEPVGVTVDIVRSDHRGGSELATKHLLKHGHRDIAFFGDDPHLFSAELRLAGFRDAMDRAHVSVPPHRIVTEHHTPTGWRDFITDYLRRDDPPTAVYSAQNFITLGAAQALHALGLQDTIAHIGFDDVDLADVVRPGISVVPQQPRDLGRRAAEMLFRRLDGADSPPTQEIIGSSVIKRGSGEIPGPAARTRP